MMKFKRRLAYFALRRSKQLLIFTTALLALSVLSVGCANPVGMSYHDFRNTRWGFSKERVMLNEQGKRIDVKKGNLIIFHHSIGNVKCKLIYCFKDNKLRAAGYITDKPVRNAQNIVKRSVEELGEPTEILNDGMVWITNSTLIYSNAYLSQRIVGEYRSSGGILSHLVEPQEPVGRWDGVWAYIDRDFYEELQDVRFPLDQLSFHEKLLFGVLKRTSITTYYSSYSGRQLMLQEDR